jgi:hypothetical protein
MENKPFVVCVSIDIIDSSSSSRKFRIAIAFIFTAEALVIGETLEINDKIDSEQNLMIFSDSASVLQGISDSTTISNTSQYYSDA